MKKILAAFIIITYIVLASVVFELYRSNQRVASLMIANQTVQAPVKKMVQLPTDAVKISECVPAMGEHWVRPQDIPNGPYYVVDQGKVIGLEYMFKYAELPGEKVARMTLPQFEKYMKDNNLTLKDSVMANDISFDLIDSEYKTVTLSWTAPHAGFPEPHIDMHAYLLPEDEIANICPNVGLDQVYSPEVIKTIQEKNIPFPEAPKQ